MTIEIKSTVRETFLRAGLYTKNVTKPDVALKHTWIYENYVQTLRTQGTDLGWDWSLALAPQGLFGRIELHENLDIVLENPLFI